MKYLIDGEEYTSAEEAADYIAEQISEDYYIDMLDDVYEDIEICGLSYSASVAFYRVDEIAYNCGFNDYKDSVRHGVVYELEEMNSDEDTDLYDCKVEAVGDDEEDEEGTE